ncbi:MAG TPA: hypothetical protein VG435_09790 [Acidimicrobiales bacterium]|nr:hypothetical protein [Acidimicrobiales bacterium]
MTSLYTQSTPIGDRWTEEDIEEQRRESRLRRAAYRQGLMLRRSRCRTPELPEWGRFHLVNRDNVIVVGAFPWNYSLSPDDVEDYLSAD